MVGVFFRRLWCAFRGHIVGTWFYRHSMGPYRHDGSDCERTHIRVGRCPRCKELVCEEYDLQKELTDGCSVSGSEAVHGHSAAV